MRRDRYNPERWKEVCAARMARTLNRKPRIRKTRQYLATLPRRPGPAVVSPDEFSAVPPVLTDYQRLLLLLRELPALPPSARPQFEPYVAPIPEVRTIRVRPRARDRDVVRLLPRMIAIQGGACVHCGGKMLVDTASDNPDRASFEHVVPRARGGRNIGNRIAAHALCNSLKSDRMPSGCELVWLMAVNAALYGDSACAK